MKILVLSPPETIPNELEYLKGFFNHGLEIFHLRKPKFSLRELEQYIQKVPVKFHPRIMLHSHHDLIDKYDLRGLHYSEKTKESWQLNNPHLKSTSFHSLAQLTEDNPIFEYVFLSPIFNSISKPGYSAAFKIEDLKQALAGSNTTVIALGGMNKQSIGRVKQLGFSGMALLGGIWNRISPVETFQEICALTNT
ncbi:thiamine phosphate synthase [Flexithrix dorotheae]|uniref:thiamine phosphate synthase n=1 Tax=Flexithrix dorotheae TaxID=70993 RepID=UPI00035E3BEE|nr:thiamine phosphate synthase [Flexithrix dorotheae]